MSIIELPDELDILRQDFGLRTYDLTFENDDTGATQVAVLGPARRMCSIVANDRMEEERAAQWTALVHALRGRVNRLAVYHVLRDQPRGTARGNWVAAVAAPAGGDALTISLGAGQAGATLLMGDWIGVHQGGVDRQLLHVQADAVADASGQIVVSVETVLRKAVPAGSVIVWDRPTCLMRRQTGEAVWSATPGEFEGGFSLDLVEAWGS